MFEAVRKFNGREEVLLSTSQTKQIAGRAGRYGLHSEAGGFATTLHANDLPILRKAMDTSIPALTNAYQHQTLERSRAISQALPANASMMTLNEVYTHVAKMRWPYHMQRLDRAELVCDFIDDKLSSLPLADKYLIMQAPIAWREAASLDIFAEFMRQYCNDFQVNLIQCLSSGPLSHLEDVESSMASDSPHKSPDALNVLEGMHKLTVLYMWMNMRLPLAWPHRSEAEDLKERIERALDWLLERLSLGKRTSSSDMALWAQQKEENKVIYRGRREIDALLRQERLQAYRSPGIQNR